MKSLLALAIFAIVISLGCSDTDTVEIVGVGDGGSGGLPVSISDQKDAGND